MPYWIAKSMAHKLSVFAIFVLILTLLSLAACDGTTVTTQGDELLLPMETPTLAPCEACAQATLDAALIQENNNADNEAAATAEIARANALATLNSVNATLSAAQTQEQSDANVIAAQIAATAEIERANAQATLNSAGSTQSAALTQDAIRQTQVADLAVRVAIAASTQTAVANYIATQTQVAAATSQWYADQARQRDEQIQAPINFLWMLCLPIFIVLLAGLVLWSFWRWVKIQQGPRILEERVDQLQAPAAEVIHHQQDDSSEYLESGMANNRPHLTKPNDQVRGWLDEVKGELRSSDEKDKDDHTDN